MPAAASATGANSGGEMAPQTPPTPLLRAICSKQPHERSEAEVDALATLLAAVPFYAQLAPGARRCAARHLRLVERGEGSASAEIQTRWVLQTGSSCLSHATTPHSLSMTHVC
jgi:hypothetical protein